MQETGSKRRECEVVGPEFDASRTYDYTLSIRFVPDGFCFIVTNSYDKELRCFFLQTNERKALPDLLRSAAEENKLLQLPYRETYFLNDEPSYALMPTDILKEDEKQRYWEFCHGALPADMTLVTHPVRMAGVTLIHSMPRTLFNVLRELFPAVRFVHRQSVNLACTMFNAMELPASHCHLFLDRNSFDVVLMERRKLLLANTFGMSDLQECLYFMLNIFEQFELNQYETMLEVSGHDAEHVAEAFRVYVRDVRTQLDPIRPLPKPFRKSVECANQHTLLNLPLCV